MNEKFITPEDIAGFEANLVSRERSPHTIARYLHDVRTYRDYLGGREATAETTCGFKTMLLEKNYAESSINTMLASLFSFFKFKNWTGCGTQRLVIQEDVYCPEERVLEMDDYRTLVAAAQSQRDKLVIQTMGSTGIRVSELRFFTVEAVRDGNVRVTCKRKTRRVMVPEDIRQPLLEYAKEKGITSGVIFRGRKERPLHRKSVWSIMKRAARAAGVLSSKAFPHNLRKLFARAFQAVSGDIVMLADVLGHRNTSTTRIYTRSTGEAHQRIVNSLGLVVGRFLSGEGQRPPERQGEIKKAFRTRKGRKGKRGKRAKK